MDNVYAVSRFLLSGSGGQGVITMATCWPKPQ